MPDDDRKTMTAQKKTQRRRGPDLSPLFALTVVAEADRWLEVNHSEGEAFCWFEEGDSISEHHRMKQKIG